ncbi:marvel-like domain [Fusarium longipes]|uniref:Marvel-like domain n=1 Tax=Fusarium longipes TaxID=694270 RepID=A0A395SZD2_9HYPO|nr:marvel-like domain [Fusarium longipes]
MQEKSPLYPTDAKEVGYLKHSPSVQDDHKLDLEKSLLSQRILNPSTHTADYRETKRLAVVAILYGLDLAQATKDNFRAHASWVYAELVAGVSMIICIMHLFFMTAVWYWGLLDALVSVLWLAQFGVFASIYLGVEGDETFATASLGRMQAAVWVNLISVFLWFATTLYGIIGCCARFRKSWQKGKSVEMDSVPES